MKKIISILTIYSSLMVKGVAADLTIHEWGTFTSFMGSNGELIEGMHHEDEPLPAFVYGLKKDQRTLHLSPKVAPCRPNPHSKVDCLTLNSLVKFHSEIFPEAPVSAGITQKMETPVIYFYGEQNQKVNVEIHFPQGIITQYYPESTFSYPKISEVRELKDSKFVFDVTLKAPNDTAIPYAAPASIWSPARKVPAANVVQSPNGDKEKFIFYRGVGNFPSPLKVTSDARDYLTLENLSSSPISMAIVLNSNGTKGNLEVINNLNEKMSVLVPGLDRGMNFEPYIQKTKAVIVRALVSNGLYNDEAVAMVNTWEKSYFHTPGVRVLYIVPSDETESILPLAIKPSPTELKRVLVGRIEVLTKNEETRYLDLIKAQTSGIDREKVFGRFYEPKLRRLEQIAPSELKEKIKALYN